MTALLGKRASGHAARLLAPLRRLLRAGVSPEQLAWSLALGAVVGVNPLIGSTTLLALGLAMLLRLNVIAAQVSNHLAYPLELLLFPVFIKLGSMLFGTPALPLPPRVMLAEAGHHPWATTRLLWTWEWHALVVWAVFACAAAPCLALGFRPVLARASDLSIRSRQAPDKDGQEL